MAIRGSAELVQMLAP